MVSPHRILIADDEPQNRELIKALLAPAGYDLIMAKDGKETLQKAFENAPDLILLDVMMPEMNGFKVAKKLKETKETKAISIVMVTSLNEKKDRIMGIESGADDFLSKPFDEIELKTRVKSLLKVKAYHDHLLTYQTQLKNEVTKKTKELKKTLLELQNASLDTIMRLSRAMEYQGVETSLHTKRVSEYSAAVANKMGLGAGMVSAIRYAAPMHDIGKICIPTNLLNRPGDITPEEREIVRNHTITGSEILKGAGKGFIKLAQVIALTHHEKWDGTGYPKGLKGDSIPFAGRIVCLADIFDVLLNKRPYKKPFTLEKSMGIIQKEKGKHFDPGVVDAFFAAEGDILVIKEKYKEE